MAAVLFFLEKNPHVFISSESVIESAWELFHFGPKPCVWESGHFCREVIIRQFQLESAHHPGEVHGCGLCACGTEQISAQHGHWEA
jgi:hypothetical protein